ncbi:MAG: NADH-quinone oxidoreductase subunit H [Spirochaetales bacterium]|nr:NADH-quinone oxidoreductase subunit H [Spirochaetales bacterium]
MIRTHIFFSFLFALGSMFFGLLFMGMGRILTARIQRRIGPPVWQSYIDVIKCFSRHSTSHHFIMDLGSMMGLAGLLAAALLVPVAGMLPFPSNGPMLVILYLMPIGYLGLAMGVSASGNPLAAIGIGRALTLMVGYEIPFVVVLLGIMTTLTPWSTMLIPIISAQSGGITSWNAFQMPFGFIAALIALQGMLAKKPFDTMIAPAEIASGSMVELSGKFLGFAFLQHAVAIFIETGLIVNMFLGGGTTLWEFLFKQAVVYLCATAVSEIYGRFRVEQAVRFLWISAGSLAMIQLIINLIVR